MKIIMIAVSSLNGKITRGDNSDIHKWTSAEDWKFFVSQREKHNLIVMGRKTFEASRKLIELKKSKLRVVLTTNPRKYSSEERKDVLEFTNESPEKLVTMLEKRGYKRMLLVGGGEIFTTFLKAKLVDEIYLTIEPLFFGEGKDLIAGHLDVRLQLISVKELNDSGTLLLKYKIIQ